MYASPSSIQELAVQQPPLPQMTNSPTTPSQEVVTPSGEPPPLVSIHPSTMDLPLKSNDHFPPSKVTVESPTPVRFLQETNNLIPPPKSSQGSNNLIVQEEPVNLPCAQGKIDSCTTDNFNPVKTLVKDGVIFTKCGNNSLEMTGSLDTRFSELNNESNVYPNYLRRVTRVLSDCDEEFPIQADGVHLIGYIHSAAMIRCTTVDQLVLPMHLAPIATAALHPLTVKTRGPSMGKGSFTLPQLDTAATGFNQNVVNKKDIAIRMQGVIPGVSVANAIRLSSFIQFGWTYYNNSLMYAKLMHYAIILEGHALIPAAVPLVAAPNDPENRINAVQYNAVNLDGNLLTQCATNGRITLQVGYDICQADMLALQYMVMAGRRLNPGASGSCPSACYISWPAVPINLLHNGHPTKEMAAAVVNPEILMGFAFKLAGLRGEFDDLVRGTYIAMELAGLRMVDCGAILGFHPLQSNLAMGEVFLPECRDFNFMLRAYGLSRTTSTELDRQEFLAFRSTTPLCRLRTVALYNACISAGMTTLLTSFSITTGDIIAWATRTEVPPLLNTVFSKLDSRHTNATMNSEIYFLSQIRAFFPKCLGVHVATDLFVSNRWIGEVGQRPNAAAVLAQYPAGFVPRLFNLMCIQNFMIIRPLEWAIIGLRPKISLSADIRANDPPAMYEWYLNRGDETYIKYASSKNPMLFIPYGVQMLNVVCSYLRWNGDLNPPIVHAMGYTHHYDHPNPRAKAPVLIDGTDSFYMAKLHTFEPCTFVSFSYADGHVRYPVLMPDTRDMEYRLSLMCLNGDQLDHIGFGLNRAVVFPEVKSNNLNWGGIPKLMIPVGGTIVTEMYASPSSVQELAVQQPPLPQMTNTIQEVMTPSGEPPPLASIHPSTLDLPLKSKDHCPPSKVTVEPPIPVRFPQEINNPKLPPKLSQGSNNLIVHEEPVNLPNAPGKIDSCITNKVHPVKTIVRDGVIFTKSGDNSLEMTGSLDTNFIMLDNVDKVHPNYLRRAADIVGYNNEQFTVCADGVHLIGHICEAEEMPIAVDQLVLPMHLAPIAAAALHPLTVKTRGPSVGKGSFTSPQLAMCFNQGQVNYGFISPHMQSLMPGLSEANANVLSSCINVGWTYYNNSLMYAKLMHYAIILDGHAQIPAAVPLVAAPNDPENRINAVQYNAVNLDGNLLTHCVINGRITLQVGYDICQADMLALQYMTMAGRRLNPGASGSCPSACYISWPEVPINLLHDGHPTEEVAAAVADPHTLMEFAYRLAGLRGEFDDLVRGTYIAMELAGLRMVDCGDILGFHPLQSNLAMGEVFLPWCLDYNFMLRTYGLSPSTSTELDRQEFEAFMCTGSLGRLRTVALYNACISAGITTLLTSLSITTGDIIAWATNAENVPPLLHFVFSKLDSPHINPTVKSEFLLMSQMRVFFPECLGVHVASDLFVSNYWLGGVGQRPNAAAVLAKYPAGFVPRLFNLMCIHDFMIMRPLEWAIIGLRPKVSLSADIRVNGPPAMHGWYADAGDRTYRKYTKSKTPMLFIPYGVQMLNVICSLLRWYKDPKPPIVYAGVYNWSYYIQDPHLIFVNPMLLIDGTDPFYMAALHTFEPCTFVSFSYADEQIRYPVLKTDTLDAKKMARLKSLKEVELDHVGYYLPRAASEEVKNMFDDLELGGAH